MAIIKPFKGLRPPKDIAQDVACLPYDVMNTEEALKMANKAIELDKMIEGAAFIFLRLAIIHYNLDQYKESIKSSLNTTPSPRLTF